MHQKYGIISNFLDFLILLTKAFFMRRKERPIQHRQRSNSLPKPSSWTQSISPAVRYYEFSAIIFAKNQSMATTTKDYIVVHNGYDEMYIPRHQILYVRGSVAHGNDDSFIIRLANGEEIEQKGFAAFRERMQDAEKIFPE
jgi:hypothetical protein